MRRADAWAALALLAAGCAAPSGPPTPLFRDPALTVERARAALMPGSSRKADVAALLGPAESLGFDSGWEVWAYRGRDAATPELVLLFGPDGVLRKARAVPAPAAGGG